MICAVLCRIQFDEYLATRYDLPVYHVNRRNHTGFVGLNDLGIAAGNNLPLSGRDNIDPPECGPQNSSSADGDNGPCDCTANGRWRRLLDLEHSRQELRGPSTWCRAKFASRHGLPRRLPDGPMFRERTECHCSRLRLMPCPFRYPATYTNVRKNCWCAEVLGAPLLRQFRPYRSHKSDELAAPC